METKSIIILSFFVMIAIVLIYIVNLYKIAKRIEIMSLVNDLSYEISQKDFLGLDYKLFNPKSCIILSDSAIRRKGIDGEEFSYKNYCIRITVLTIDGEQRIIINASYKSFSYTKKVYSLKDS